MTEREERQNTAEALRGLRRQLRRAGGRCDITRRLLGQWRQRAKLLQVFRRSDWQNGCWL